MPDEVSPPVPIPADVDQPDKILAGLTARQVAIAATAAVIVWAGWVAARHILPLPAFAVLAAPVALAATALVIGERDGLSLDRLLAAAWRQARSRAAWSPPPKASRHPRTGLPRPARRLPRRRCWRRCGANGLTGSGRAAADQPDCRGDE